MNKFRALFKNISPSVIGMIHVAPLPGSPRFGGSVNEIIDRACEEAELYRSCNVDSVMIENMHDIPYIKSNKFGPEVVSTMTRVCSEVKRILPKNMPIGVQVLACGNKESLAIAKVCNLNFVRVEGFVFGHVADEGYCDACAGSILRYRKQMDCEDILIFSDIKKKHSSHSITNDVSLEDTAKAAEFFLSDGVIITGTATGMATDVNEISSVKRSVNIPVLVGSGVSINNSHDYLNVDAIIIGSYFKENQRWENKLCKTNVYNFMDHFNSMKANLDS